MKITCSVTVPITVPVTVAVTVIDTHLGKLHYLSDGGGGSTFSRIIYVLTEVLVGFHTFYLRFLGCLRLGYVF